MKFFNAQARLLTWKIAFVSASVESAAIDDWMLHDHATMTALSRPTVDCMDR